MIAVIKHFFVTVFGSVNISEVLCSNWDPQLYLHLHHPLNSFNLLNNNHQEKEQAYIDKMFIAISLDHSFPMERTDKLFFLLKAKSL